MKSNLSSEISLSRVSRRLYCPDDVFEQSRVTRLEQVRTTVYESARVGIAAVASHIAEQIRQRQQRFQPYVMSLAPGRSTRDICAELVRKHREEGLSFRNVIFFDLYEYYPLADDSLGNHAQVKSHLLDHIDVLPENIHTIPWNMKKEEIVPFCQEYERSIAAVGGIDFQLLGIGVQFHHASGAAGQQFEGRCQNHVRFDRASAGECHHNGYRHHTASQRDHAGGMGRAQGTYRTRGN